MKNYTILSEYKRQYLEKFKDRPELWYYQTIMKYYRRLEANNELQ